MTLEQITASDITGWDSLEDIADSFEKRGLKPRLNLGEDHELVLQLADDEFVTIVEAGPGESATDFKPQNRTRHTNFVATNDFENFTFLTRIRSWEGQQHGRIKHQKLSFSKKQFQSKSGEKNTILQKMNSIEYGSSAAIYDSLYDTRQVVQEFYQQFESLRTDLVQEVSSIPNDRGDAKQRYVQVILDRMIFLYFIQEKRLLDRNPDYLHEQPAKVVKGGDDRYEEFYEPLFFDYLAEDKQNPEFGKLPYLNGGLFAKNPIEEEFEDAKLGDSAKKTNELFDDILDFLSDWNWNVDERLDIVDPKNLSPSVLGHIFEQTVNQKEMGAYYTPEEITGFMARQTVHPYLLDQLNETACAAYEEIDDVFGFPEVNESPNTTAIADGGAITQQAPTDNVNIGHVETFYHDILKEAHILDPAVGSGAFLLATQEILIDLYMHCIEFFQQLENEGKGWELESRTRDELDTISSGKGNASLYSKRTIIINNLYGVDIDQGAVEICKLRLWLSMVADIEDEPGEVEPLPNIDFNIRQGNSLVGFTDIIEINQDGDAPLTNFGGGVGDSVRDKYEDIIEVVEKHRNAETATDAANWRKEAERQLDTYRKDLNKKVLEEFREAGINDISLKDIEEQIPFHWVLEFASVYAEGGFDIVIGNPPWDKVKAERDDFFPQYDEAFRSRMPDKKKAKQQELLENPKIKDGWENYQDSIKKQAKYFNNSPNYNLQATKIDGRKVSTENDLSALFLERVFELSNEDGYVSQVLPGVTFNGGSKKALREHLLDKTEMKALAMFENRGIFENIDTRYNFGVIVFKNNGRTDEVVGKFQKGNASVLRGFEENALRIPRSVLARYSPEAKIFPNLEHQNEVSILKKMVQHPPLIENIDDSWHADPYGELHRTNDTDRFVETPEQGDYPVLGGGNIYQFSHNNRVISDLGSPKFWSVEESKNPDKSAKRRIREKNLRKLKKGLYDEFDGTGSQVGFVNNLLEKHRDSNLKEEDVLLDCTEYRIVYRHVARPTDERTFIAAVIPKGVVCHNALTTIRPYKINADESDLSADPLHTVYEKVFTDRELFACLGLLNSLSFDYLMRTKIDSNIVMYKFKESQIPRLTDGDQWFEYIWERAAKLNCYGDEFTDMRDRLGIEPVTEMNKRRQLRAEIDAASFHTIGLNDNEVEYVLSNFHRVTNPRIMDDDYFESVLSKYRSLQN